MGYTAVTVLKIVGLSRSTYYYNIKKRINAKGVNEDEKINKSGRPIPGYSFDKDGKRICDDQIKEYILEIIETEGLYYGYYKITVLLRRKFNLIINKKKHIDYVKSLMF